MGKTLGSKLKDIISIVSWRSFLRWANEEKPKSKPVKPGRPRRPEEIRQLIIQMAKDTGWGYRRILGELKKLRTRAIFKTLPILESDGIEFRPIPPRSPNLNPYSEAWVQRTKHEVLNHFLVFGKRHLRHILASWVHFYHKFRPHQGLGNVLLDERDKSPHELSDVVPLGKVTCHESLGVAQAL